MQCTKKYVESKKIQTNTNAKNEISKGYEQFVDDDDDDVIM